MRNCSRHVASLALLGVLLGAACGGNAARDTGQVPSQDAGNDGGESGAHDGDCDDAPESTCGGGSNVDPTTGIRFSCGGTTTVNRTGPPVSICHHIK